MKFATLFIPVVAGLLVACGPAAQPETPAPEPPVTLPAPTAEIAGGAQKSPVATPTPAALIETPGSPVATPPPADTGSEEVGVRWNTDPAAVVVSATFCCGFTTPLAPLNYIPDVQVWGDGRIVWVERDDGGRRRVLEGRLAEADLAAALQRVVDAGFFGWQDRYADNRIADAAEQCLAVTLEGRSKRVCEYFAGAPDAFHALYDFLAAGAGAAGVDYLPETGYLISYPLDTQGRPVAEADLVWPAESAGLALAEVVDGAWVEGEALRLAWQAVNANLAGPFVQEGENYYEISLQIPGLSMIAPPGR